jgi:hypothetical protein
MRLLKDKTPESAVAALSAASMMTAPTPSLEQILSRPFTITQTSVQTQANSAESALSQIAQFVKAKRYH